MEVSGQLHTPTALPSGKELLTSADRSVVRPQSRFGRCGKEKNVFPQPGMEP
jgi:hypothetical protein